MAPSGEPTEAASTQPAININVQAGGGGGGPYEAGVPSGGSFLDKLKLPNAGIIIGGGLLAYFLFFRQSPSKS